MLKVVVTGAGSGVGQGIMKALKISTLPIHIVAVDIAAFNSGLYRADSALIWPPVESPRSLEMIINSLRTISPDALMVGSEFDLGFYSTHRQVIQEETGVLVLASDKSVVAVADDKWLTSEYLRKRGLPHPRSMLADSEEQAFGAAESLGYPCVLKPRVGTSSRQVHIVRSPIDLRAVFSTVHAPLLQEMVAEPGSVLDREYTCSVFRCADGELVGPFTARRTLRGGSSWTIEVDKFEFLHPLLLKIAADLPSVGSLNIQLMAGAHGPVPFELNARFSGTTAVRAYFGFNEPEMALRSYLLGEKIVSPAIRNGMAFRYLEEVFVDGVRASDLSAGNVPKGRTMGWF